MIMTIGSLTTKYFKLFIRSCYVCKLLMVLLMFIYRLNICCRDFYLIDLFMTMFLSGITICNASYNISQQINGIATTNHISLCELIPTKIFYCAGINCILY